MFKYSSVIVQGGATVTFIFAAKLLFLGPTEANFQASKANPTLMVTCQWSTFPLLMLPRVSTT